jgi:DNA primase
MRDHLAQLGYDDARQLEGGLLAQREESGELRPRFRGRLMIPILDGPGRHVGFGGRVIGEGEPKYLNSPETRVFSKGSLLFNYHAARHVIRKEDRALVVEGFFDAIRIAEAGIDWVVAPLGTALAEGQGALLRRTTKNAYLLYDGDAAGLKATFRAADELLRHGMAVQIVTLPTGDDPDSFVRAHGADKLLEQVDRAIDVFERKIQLLERGGWFGDLHRKRGALDRLIPTIRATADALTRDLYLTRAAEVGGVSKDLLQQEANRPERGAWSGNSHRLTGASTEKVRGSPQQAGTHPASVRSTRPPPAEVHLVRVMLRDRSQIDFVLERTGAQDFQDAACRELVAAFVTHGADAPVEQLARDVSAASRSLMESLLSDDVPISNKKAMDDALSDLECRKIRLRSQEIDELRKQGRGDEDALFKERQALRRRAKELKCRGPYWKEF